MRNKIMKVWSVIFILILFVTILNILNINIDSTNISNASFSKIRTNIQNIVNKSLPLKNEIIEINNYIKLNIFHSNKISKVIIGKNDWLFYYGDKEDPSIKDYEGKNIMSDVKMEEFQYNLNKLKTFTEKKGIPLILLVPPNKERVYSEFMPDCYTEAEYTRLDQIEEKLKNDLTIIDLRNDLTKAKKESQVYFKYDTHWNHNGAFIGYTDLMDVVSGKLTDIKVYKKSDYTIKKEDTSKLKDLGRMLLMNQYKEKSIDYILNRELNIKDKTIDNTEKKIYGDTNQYHGTVIKENKQGKYKILMSRDSFSTALIPFVSSSFERSTFIWITPLSYKLIDEEKPDVIVFESVERLLETRVLQFLNDLPDLLLDSDNDLYSKITNTSHNIKYAKNIDINNNYVNINGWAFINGKSTNNTKTYIYLKSKNKKYIFQTTPQKRHDVTKYFDDGNNYDNSGFQCIIDTNDIMSGNYEIGIVLKDGDTIETKKIDSKVLFSPSSVEKITFNNKDYSNEGIIGRLDKIQKI